MAVSDKKARERRKNPPAQTVPFSIQKGLVVHGAAEHFKQMEREDQPYFRFQTPEGDWVIVRHPASDGDRYYFVDAKGNPDRKFPAYTLDAQGRVVEAAASHILVEQTGKITRVAKQPEHLRDLISLDEIKNRIQDNKNGQPRWELDDDWEIVASSEGKITHYYLVDRFDMIGKGSYGAVFPGYRIGTDPDSPNFGQINRKLQFVLKDVLLSPSSKLVAVYKLLIKENGPYIKRPSFSNFLELVRKAYNDSRITDTALALALRSPEHNIHKYLSEIEKNKKGKVEAAEQQAKRDARAFNAAVGFAAEPLILAEQERDGSPRCYQIMERIDGVPLKKFDLGKLTFKQRVGLAIQFGQVLQLYQREGLIHFDVNYTNVLIRTRKKKESLATDEKGELKEEDEFELILFDPITQDRSKELELENFEGDLDSLKPIHHYLGIGPWQTGQYYHSNEAAVQDETGKVIEGRISEAGAKTDIDMGARRVVNPLFQGFKEDKSDGLKAEDYPVIRGKSIQPLMEAFSKRMSPDSKKMGSKEEIALKYKGQAGLIEFQRFYQTVHVLTVTQEELIRLKEHKGSEEERRQDQEADIRYKEELSKYTRYLKELKEYKEHNLLKRISWFYRILSYFYPLAKPIEVLKPKKPKTKDEQREQLIIAYEDTITIGLAKLALINAGLWNSTLSSESRTVTKFDSKKPQSLHMFKDKGEGEEGYDLYRREMKSTTETAELTSRVKRPLLEDYDFERHPIASKVFLALDKAGALTPDLVRFVVEKTREEKIHPNDQYIFKGLLEQSEAGKLSLASATALVASSAFRGEDKRVTTAPCAASSPLRPAYMITDESDRRSTQRFYDRSSVAKSLSPQEFYAKLASQEDKGKRLEKFKTYDKDNYGNTHKLIKVATEEAKDAKVGDNKAMDILKMILENIALADKAGALVKRDMQLQALFSKDPDKRDPEKSLEVILDKAIERGKSNAPKIVA